MLSTPMASMGSQDSMRSEGTVIVDGSLRSARWWVSTDEFRIMLAFTLALGGRLWLRPGIRRTRPASRRAGPDSRPFPLLVTQVADILGVDEIAMEAPVQPLRLRERLAECGNYRGVARKRKPFRQQQRLGRVEEGVIGTRGGEVQVILRGKQRRGAACRLLQQGRD